MNLFSLYELKTLLLLTFKEVVEKNNFVRCENLLYLFFLKLQTNNYEQSRINRKNC
jgi:hypothetical protein